MESGSFAARNRFGPDSSGCGRVGPIATPTPLGVGDVNSHLLFPPHVIRDHRKLIAGYRLHHEKRKLQMLRRPENGSLAAWQLAATLFPKVCETQVFLVMSEVIGHLDLLLDEGSVVIEERGGVEYARAVS